MSIFPIGWLLKGFLFVNKIVFFGLLKLNYIILIKNWHIKLHFIVNLIEIKSFTK